MTALRKPKQPQLVSEDWVATAIEALIEGGVELVQITELARRLSITRGSFYWHFENRDDLLASVLMTWRARNTGVMLEALREADTLDDGLLSLFDVWVDKTRFDPALDGAIRDWGRRSEAVAEAVREEDAARVAAIAGFLERFEFEATEAFVRARVIYFTQLTYYAQGLEEEMSDRLSYLDPYFRCFIGRDAEPAAKAVFAKRQLEGGK